MRQQGGERCRDSGRGGVHLKQPYSSWSEAGRLRCSRINDGGDGRYRMADLRRDLPMPFWLLLWFATNVIVPRLLRGANEPMGSRDAAYTPHEVARLVASSRLSEATWRVATGPLWVSVEGTR